MQYKPIKNYHMKNAILGKDFNLSVTRFFFHVFTLLDKILGNIISTEKGVMITNGMTLSDEKKVTMLSKGPWVLDLL
jgi:hypothetical protein